VLLHLLLRLLLLLLLLFCTPPPPPFILAQHTHLSSWMMSDRRRSWGSNANR
jgi:hypothetical protein